MDTMSDQLTCHQWAVVQQGINCYHNCTWRRALYLT